MASPATLLALGIAVYAAVQRRAVSAAIAALAFLPFAVGGGDVRLPGRVKETVGALCAARHHRNGRTLPN